MLKKTLYAVAVLALAVGGALSQDKGGKGGGKGGAPKGPGMALSSPDFQDGGIIPDKFTQADPMPVSPRLEWTNVPPNTESFVLIMHDPDNALNGGTDDVLHWIMFNIPGTARGLAGGLPTDATLPDGTIQAKGIRNVGYMGPGNAAINPYHHYTLELYALNAKLTLGPDATRADVMKAMDTHTVGKAVLVGRFKRPQ
ncbi:MAG: family phospholipid-binding protein [Bryobacterales bacterium]|jgi:Raf kinase inhibitor-like YbhB/YbcL family protein|nr:family phospholipid-binding protein [Bryobacterales bacterium]